ncbi:uncharacterized protein isoform X2 [Castor canadensis]|uniref:Uncharacterized protein isoform X2 n=1 Tax=Castor canadensis TaxID=51338 RepID=A0AC58MCZ0_CASCN
MGHSHEEMLEARQGHLLSCGVHQNSSCGKCKGKRWAPVAGCGIAGSAATSAPARRPARPHRRSLGLRRSCLRGRRGARRGSPEGAPGAESPAGADTACPEQPACSCSGDCSRAGPIGCLLQHEPVLATEGVRNPAAPNGLQQPPGPTAASNSAASGFRTKRERCSRRSQPRAARCVRAAPASGSAAAADREASRAEGPGR